MKYPASVSLSFKNWLLPASSFLQTLVPLLASFGLSAVVSSLSDRLRGFPANFSFTSPRLDLAADSCLPHARWDLTAIFPLGWDPAAFLSFINVRLDLTANYPLRWDLAALLSITNGRLYPAANYPLRVRTTRWNLAAIFPTGLRGWILLPTILGASAVGSRRYPFDYRRAAASHRRLGLLCAHPRWDLVAPPRQRMGGGILPPTPLSTSAVGFHRHFLVYARAVGTYRQPMVAVGSLRHLVVWVRAVGSSRRLPRMLVQLDLTAGSYPYWWVESHRADSALAVLPEDLWAYNSRAGDFLAIS
ncbi:hypothetical protein C8F04DRAFT_1272370 [Mycena alexandri]|uniref:Uncharacterized protein n=1 Tax=Mycena alexandri TaxID=1745969 RepID=A0AAD6S871_9AGAR|nr:hypothetical protein C8F04DRAFT_1272370 [Mycena alexandri]